MNREGIEAAKGICEKLSRQLVKVDKALDEEGGKLPANDVTYLKELTGSVKNIETILAMAGDGSSERRGRDSMGRFTSRADGGSYDDGHSERGYAYEDGSYRYGRSMHGEDMREKLRRMADETGDEKVKRALLRAASDM